MDDIGRAFTFPFKDPQWFAKFLIGSLMCMLAVIGVGFFDTWFNFRKLGKPLAPG